MDRCFVEQWKRYDFFFAFASLKMLRVNCGDKITRLKASPIGHFMDIDKLDKPCHPKLFLEWKKTIPYLTEL